MSTEIGWIFQIRSVFGGQISRYVSSGKNVLQHCHNWQRKKSAFWDIWINFWDIWIKKGSCL
jgi:hypothetical protein